MKTESTRSYDGIALTAVREAVEMVRGDQIVGLVGPHADVESTLALRDLLHRLGSERIEAKSTKPKVGVNLRSEYLSNSRIEGISQADYVLLVGTNLRTEAPLLNTRILRLVEDQGTEVAVLGVGSDLNYPYDHVGTSPATLAEIAEGKHPVSKALAEAEYPMIIVSAGALGRSDGEAIMNNIKKICQAFEVIDANKNWNGLNILHQEASSAGACDLGI